MPAVAAGFLPAVLARGEVQVGKPAPTVGCMAGVGERVGLPDVAAGFLPAVLARGPSDVAAGFLPAVLAQGGVQVGKPAPTVGCTGCGERAGLARRAGLRKSVPSRRWLARHSLCVLRLAKPIQEYPTRSASNPKKEPDTFANLVKCFAELAKVFRNSCEMFRRIGETCRVARGSPKRGYFAPRPWKTWHPQNVSAQRQLWRGIRS